MRDTLTIIHKVFFLETVTIKNPHANIQFQNPIILIEVIIGRVTFKSFK